VTAVLRLEQKDSVWTFALSRPEKMNALSSELVEALIDGVADAHARGARLLVFKGEGKNFSAGFDFGNLDQSSDGDLLLRFVRVATLLHMVATSPCSTLALAHGRNFGAGVDLFGVCRRRYCTGAATFRMPGLMFGIVLGTRRFASLVGREAAIGILETARTFGAEEARTIGFAGLAEIESWPQILADAAVAAQTLGDRSRAALYGAVSDESPDADLAALVRSAAQPGLKDRIRAYVQAGK
jgi:enoyl-CoA hydratase